MFSPRLMSFFCQCIWYKPTETAVSSWYLEFHSYKTLNSDALYLVFRNQRLCACRSKQPHVCVSGAYKCKMVQVNRQYWKLFLANCPQLRMSFRTSVLEIRFFIYSFLEHMQNALLIMLYIWNNVYEIYLIIQQRQRVILSFSPQWNKNRWAIRDKLSEPSSRFGKLFLMI